MFVPVATPQTESELVSMMSLLHAHDIPHYVHNRNFGALYPGPLIPLYNVHRVMVERTRVVDARELLAPFFVPPQDYETESYRRSLCRGHRNGGRLLVPEVSKMPANNA